MHIRQFFLLFLIVAPLTSMKAQRKEFVKKRVEYKKYSKFDFTGETVQGKVNAPAVFYIFQRKRSSSHHIAAAPSDFSFALKAKRDEMRRSLSSAEGNQ